MDRPDRIWSTERRHEDTHTHEQSLTVGESGRTDASVSRLVNVIVNIINFRFEFLNRKNWLYKIDLYFFHHSTNGPINQLNGSILFQFIIMGHHILVGFFSHQRWQHVWLNYNHWKMKLFFWKEIANTLFKYITVENQL